MFLDYEKKSYPKSSDFSPAPSHNLQNSAGAGPPNSRLTRHGWTTRGEKRSVSRNQTMSAGTDMFPRPHVGTPPLAASGRHASEPATQLGTVEETDALPNQSSCARPNFGGRPIRSGCSTTSTRRPAGRLRRRRFS
uniref:Uncharacterized protein n=1 Tax=Arundo donax TaxID=35708 RepID=A0A0A8XZN1_ARUDO